MNCPRCKKPLKFRLVDTIVGQEQDVYCQHCAYSHIGSPDPEAIARNAEELAKHPECSVVGCEDRNYYNKRENGLCAKHGLSLYYWQRVPRKTYPPLIEIPEKDGKRFMVHPMAGKWKDDKKRSRPAVNKKFINYVPFAAGQSVEAMRGVNKGKIGTILKLIPDKCIARVLFPGDERPERYMNYRSLKHVFQEVTNGTQHTGNADGLQRPCPAQA